MTESNINEAAKAASNSDRQQQREVPAGTAITLRAFSLSAGGKPLLNDANVTFPAGKLTLVLGCSGVGKSLLLRILAGLIDEHHAAIRYSGHINFGDEANTKARNHAEHPVAVVFQSFALFDELTPIENIEIAIEHSSQTTVSRNEANQKAHALLNELGVPEDRTTSVLSGGQQQRLAIARAVGMETDVVLYDEPTSGLDTNTAAQVAELIRDTQTKFTRTSIIVTHDFEALKGIADHVVLLNHHDRTLQEVKPDQWSVLPELLGDPPRVESSAAGPASATTRATQAIGRAMAACGEFVEQALLLPVALVPWWKSFRWGSRITWHYIKLVCGWSACFYIAIAGMIIGFVAQDFIFRYLPFRQYTEPLLIENLLHATGFSLYRFLVPILCTILIAARSGAAVAADVGSKVYGNQLDAMKTIGMNPSRSVRTPILYAFLIGVPLLTFLSYGVASLTSAVAFLSTHAREGIAFWDAHFHKELRLPTGVFYKGTGWLFGKLLTCAVGIAMISWKCGSAPKQSAPEISRGVTQTILWSTLFTLLVHFVFSLFEFKAPT
ncbi:ATP-binding cassette domain-containing protein [Fuerstiella marisgermanici]|uniref:Arginine transport ATP-binding protein ArtP n=1 Tax=Fuerstiella marisgermanici TaxID=1891926 RepID=A0A1P8W9H4_9PLAN|nr:ATP-binding cassette domain-containing protein [Fuerstiella marisgermanici]APZ90681.1 Arginine transport ATP-binding protein ArtP [Fuerstiella marisgermanici]